MRTGRSVKHTVTGFTPRKTSFPPLKLILFAFCTKRTSTFFDCLPPAKLGNQKVLSRGWCSQKISVHGASTLEFNRSSRLESKASLQSLEHHFADVSTTGRAMRFKPACGVHRVTPDVVNEFSDADKARNDAADLHPDAQTEAAELAVQLSDVFVHRQRHRSHGGEMIRILLECTTGH